MGMRYLLRTTTNVNRTLQHGYTRIASILFNVQAFQNETERVPNGNDAKSQ